MIAHRKRLVWLSLCLLALFCLLIVQFYKIQIIEGEKWTKVALHQHQLLVKEPPQRGLFYSNTSIKLGHPSEPVPFVITVPKFHLFADPDSLPMAAKREVAKKLFDLLSLEASEKQKLVSNLLKKSRSRKLIMWLSKEKKEQILSWWGSYARKQKIPRNALYFVQDYKRSYPFGDLLGQVLHTVREEKDLKTHCEIPTGGLELVLNDYLKGKEGKRVILRSPRHPLDTGSVLAAPEKGADVYLTINHYLQAVAEEEIQTAVKQANAKGGWAIMMEPRTGEIWAFAQYPTFSPTAYREFFNHPELLEHTKAKAITDPYEPGSIMKPLTLAIAMKANSEVKKQGKPPLFTPFEKISTADGHFPGRSKPIKDTHFHSFLNMSMALQKSSNIYYSRLVQRIVDHLGVDWYRNALVEFGFGEKTGIELPSESIGLLPTPGKLHPNGRPEWSVPTPYSIAMGHNILATSLQMLRSYAILANGGYDVKPTLIRKIVRDDQVLVANTAQAGQRLLDPEIVDEVIKAMKYVTKSGGVSRADIPGYTEAGKTGTTEKVINGVYSKKDHISTFIGFAPAHNARFVLLVVIDDPEYKYIPGVGRNQLAQICAAPAFREIGLKTLEYLGIERDDPFGYPKGDPRANRQRADWTKEVEASEALYKEWNQ